MPATTLDGKATAAAIRAELSERVAALAAAHSRPGSRWHVDAEHPDCAQLGIAGTQRGLPAEASEQAAALEALSA